MHCLQSTFHAGRLAVRPAGHSHSRAIGNVREQLAVFRQSSAGATLRQTWCVQHVKLSRVVCGASNKDSDPSSPASDGVDEKTPSNEEKAPSKADGSRRWKDAKEVIAEVMKELQEGNDTDKLLADLFVELEHVKDGLACSIGLGDGVDEDSIAGRIKSLRFRLKVAALADGVGSNISIAFSFFAVSWIHSVLIGNQLPLHANWQLLMSSLPWCAVAGGSAALLSSGVLDKVWMPLKELRQYLRQNRIANSPRPEWLPAVTARATPEVIEDASVQSDARNCFRLLNLHDNIGEAFEALMLLDLIVMQGGGALASYLFVDNLPVLVPHIAYWPEDLAQNTSALRAAVTGYFTIVIASLYGVAAALVENALFHTLVEPYYEAQSDSGNWLKDAVTKNREGVTVFEEKSRKLDAEVEVAVGTLEVGPDGVPDVKLDLGSFFDKVDRTSSVQFSFPVLKAVQLSFLTAAVVLNDGELFAAFMCIVAWNVTVTFTSNIGAHGSPLSNNKPSNEGARSDKQSQQLIKL